MYVTMVYTNYIHECCVGSTNTEGKPVYKGNWGEPENVPNFKHILLS